MNKRSVSLAVSVAAVLLLAGCADSGASVPSVTGAATEYKSVTELRDAFVAAGGSCESWETIDPGEYDAQAGRCSDSVVMAVYQKRDELDAAVKRASELVIGTHLLVGENWMINVENPQNYVAALGGTTVG